MERIPRPNTDDGVFGHGTMQTNIASDATAARQRHRDGVPPTPTAEPNLTKAPHKPKFTVLLTFWRAP
jgi:hypothetical protein